jgi:L-malate glycosyltransferase
MNRRKLCLLYIMYSTASPHTDKWIRMAAKRHEVHILCSESGVHPAATSVHLCLNGNSIYRKLLMRVKFVYKCLLLHCKLKPDITHVHFVQSKFHALSYFFARRLILSVWGSDIYSPAGCLSNWIRRVILERADHVICTTRTLAYGLYAHCNKIPAHSVIPFGVETEKFFPKAEYATSEIIRIGCVKHFLPIYGIDVLVDAISIVVRKTSKLKVFLVGSGSGKSETKARIIEKDLSGIVSVLDYIPNPELPEFLRRLDIFVMPSKIESFGVSALEAAGSGIPIIASNVGGIPEAVKQNFNGLLVEANNPEVLATAILKLIENQALREELGRNGPVWVRRNFELADCYQKIDDLYFNIMSKQKSSTQISKELHSSAT